MARIVKDYDERYAEFLDVAQQLFFTKGYEKTSVQEIINTVGVAKGTFYHYFDSKVDILDALIRRLLEDVKASLDDIVHDESMNAVEKVERYFSFINQWKIESKPFLLQTARVLYQDQNVLLRYKMHREALKSFNALLATIIEQGMDEGVFDVAHPLATAEVIIMIPRIFEETLIPFLMSDRQDTDMLEHIKAQIAVYGKSVERVLGMTTESLTLFRLSDLEEWLVDDEQI